MQLTIRNLEMMIVSGELPLNELITTDQLVREGLIDPEKELAFELLILRDKLNRLSAENNFYFSAKSEHGGIRLLTGMEGSNYWCRLIDQHIRRLRQYCGYLKSNVDANKLEPEDRAIHQANVEVAAGISAALNRPRKYIS